MVNKKLSWFICRYCGTHEYEKDWGWKERNLYFTLKKERVCEDCARIGIYGST